MVHLQNGCFLDHAEQHENTERGVEVQGFATQPEAEQSEGHCQRQREQDRQRMDEVLELGRQHDVHENERQDKSPGEVAQCAFEFAAAPEYPCAVAGRHSQFRGRLAYGLNAIAQGEAGGDVRSESGHALAIQPVDASGAPGGAEMDHVVQSRRLYYG